MSRTPLLCPACHQHRTRRLPASRGTGRPTMACTDCGMQSFVDLGVLDADVVGLDEITTARYDGYVQAKRDGGRPQVWRDTLAGIRRLLGPDRPDATLYDVGAGDGGFLDLAREEFGFHVAGNEVSVAATDLARERYDVDLELGDLAGLGHIEDQDAVTMWCVLAHVPDGDQLLLDTWKMLRPGGVLYLQTPRLTKPDRTAFAALRATRGRVSKLTDRRLDHHVILHTVASVTAQLERVGFTDVRAVPKARYTLSSELYAYFFGARGRFLPVAASALDLALDHGLAPRIVLDVVARKAA